MLGSDAVMSRFSPLLCAACLALLACSDGPSTTRPDVLLVSLDTLRADRLGCYGYERDTSPFLDSLAARGVRFANAYVATHGTPPSHASIFTSLYQESHEVSYHVGGNTPRNDNVPEDLRLLPEVLQDAGYVTIGVTGGGYVSSNFGFDQGFDLFVDRPVDVVKGTRRLVEELRLRRYSHRPIFAFFHTYEIHSPYDPPVPWRDAFGEYESDFEATNENLVPLQESARPTLDDEDIAYLNALYDAGIRYTDHVLEELWGELESAGFFDRPHLVILTSDHGEEFAEHGGLLHRVSLYEELVRVPLIILGTDVPAGRVEEQLVSTVDIAPTIYAAVGVDPRKPMVGTDLLAATTEPDRPVFFQYADRLYGLRLGSWKLIEHRKGPERGRLELYDLANDPGEQNDVARERPEITRDLRRRLHEWRENCLKLDLERPDADVSEESLEQLRALGYVQ